MLCQNCGSLIKDGDLFCCECGTPVTKINYGGNNGYNGSNGNGGNNGNRTSSGSSSQSSTQSRVGNVSNTVGSDGVNTRNPKLLFGLKAAEGEVPVRQYYCSQLKIPSCKGYLTVTNKRLIFQGKSTGTSRVSQEIPIDSVGAIYCGYGTFIKWAMLIISLLLVGVGFYLLDDGSDTLGVISTLVGLVLAAFSFRKSFTLSVKSAKAVGDGISVGMGGSGAIGSGASFAVIGFAAADTDKMLNELGAMVQDLQTKGDLALEKWAVKK